MCDQTEVTYSPGDVVWVKLGPVWWPGQVQDYDKLPEEITHDLRKRPIAVVKFFQEDTYEYVKNLNQIYHYNCRKKEEFIKKGLDMVRSSNTREVPSNMSMFPNDIVMAEHITGGDPNILESDSFAPEQKTNYSELFGTAKKSTGKKGKADSLKKEFRRHSESPVGSNRKILTNLPATIPRPITHPRFITKALEGKSDHEVRIRCQISVPKDDEESSEANVETKKYKCHLCDFQSARLNVIVLHNKSHSAGFIEAQNAIKAKLKTKERERISLGPISLSEQTPTTVTSRGRVKSLPKKLMDYTDEPPPKMLKEKSYSKHIKEEPSESANENCAEKTPKKQKVVSEKTAVKRPLFGKRKSAKEKAEIAAKLKQENEAMKETLLKDWDDDDVNEEEVELERLKQALESTTTSSFEDEIDSPPKEIKTAVQDKPFAKSKEQPSKSDASLDKPAQKSNDVKSKVFEFDDSEDNLPVNINFRLKNKQEKFTDDKFKKPRPPKPLARSKSKASTLTVPPPPLFSEKKDEDKETADLTEAFNALLEETAVPELPEIPNASANLSPPFSDQTSDISSSTDLVEAIETSGDINSKMNLDVLTKESCLINNDLQMECTSSDNEEVNTSDRGDMNNVEVQEIDENQKNMMEVSAIPSAETDSEVISSGDASTTSCDLTSPTVETILTAEGAISEDSTSTEISSTCDGPKSFIGEKESVLHSNVVMVNENIESKTDYIDTEKSVTLSVGAIINEHKTLDNSHNDTSLVNDASLFEVNSRVLTEVDQAKVTVKESGNDCTNYTNTEVLIDKSKNLSVSVDENRSTEETELIKEEIVKNTDSKDNFDSSVLFSGNLKTNQLEEVIPQRSSNVHLILPASTDPNISSAHISSQHQVETVLVPKLEIQDQNSIENQTMSQSLQDMELDINSMPVIIGGEDFIQPEQPKPHLVPIQPKYSESIVISPKVNSTASSKPENVIVHLSEPSSSNSNVQSLISLPSKGVKGGGRGGRTPKTTSKTIKLSASTLKNLGSLQKGGNQQVLILKTASTKDSQEKGSLQKTQGPLNLIQHGNKILIVNNPQMTGQNKIKLNPQQQQLLTGGKLAPGTRVFTSKVVATTTPPSNETNKTTSTSRSSSKPTQKLVISKGGLLSNVSKSVIINSNQSGKLISAVPGLQNITSSKGQTFVTHNILNTKGGLILPSSSQSAPSSNKAATIITSQSLPSSKGMILTPITSKSGQIISGNQKLRIVSSKAPLSGTRFVVQSSQGKTATVDAQQKGQQIKLISGLKGQASGSTILIQTSQGLVAKSISPSSASATTKTINLTTARPKSVSNTISSPTKIRVSTSPSQPTMVVQQTKPNTAVQKIVQQPVTVKPSPTVKKVTVQKVRQSPNILQKPPRKSNPRGSKATGSRAKVQPVPTATEPIILSTSASLPVIAQPTLVQTQIPQGSEGLLYLTLDESGNYRQLDSKSLITIEGNPTDAPRTIYIPASSQPQDVGNVFLTIDDTGMTQLVNIAQPTPSTSFTQENPAPAQDILAKALANTQVFQQETIIPDVDVTTALASSVDSSALASSSFVEQAQYPAPSLSHSVQETSLTLTQPIMTPLEVPSNVSPGLGQISSLPSNYITTNLITSKQKNIHPSMPLLTEESLTSQSRGEPVFLLDSSNNIIPLTSGSQTSFQLTLDENMVTMSSSSDGSVLPQTYQVVSGDILTSQLISTQGTHSLPKEQSLNSTDHQEKVPENISFSVLQETSQISSDETHTTQHSGILREALEAPQSFKSEHFLNSVEMTQSGSLSNLDQMEKMEEHSSRVEDSQSTDAQLEQIVEDHTMREEDGNHTAMEEVNHSLKRSLGEEQMVTSSSDHQDDLKRIRLDER